MNIRNLNSFLESFWDWSFLNDCFGNTNVRVGDVDGFVGSYGNWILLETKRPGVTVPTPQHYNFMNLQNTGMFTIIVIWGMKNMVQQLQLYKPNGIITPIFDATNKDLHDKVKNWFIWANKNKKIGVFK